MYQPPQQGQPYYQPPNGPYPPPQRYPPSYPPQKPRKKPNVWLWIVGAVVLFSLFAYVSIATSTAKNGTSTTTATPTSQATTTPTAKPTPQPVRYPPVTVADLHALAAKGDASAIVGFHSESTGLVAICPQPKRFVTVDPSITGQQLAQDLLAYFYAGQLDSPCGSLILVYHQQSESNDVYTAGLIHFDVTDASGGANTDPNASGLKYTLTLDIGTFDAHQEAVVTY